jgi:UDP-arabinose 4-epimerase
VTRILVTGGAGYVGSHTCKLLAQEGHEIAIFDNLARGHRELVKWGPLIEGDLRNGALLRDSLLKFRPEAVIHFAALAYVGESASDPGLYYDNNVNGSLSLLSAMRDTGVGRIVVSSTCAVYGQPAQMPITEDMRHDPINPYGSSKAAMERICRDFGAAHGIRSVALRYFNAAGCDPDGKTGERHNPEPHLIPRALMALDGEIDALDVFGDDYPTPDGTCIRDYVHVSDLASAHAMAARFLIDGGGSDAFNLGTGCGVSVREVLDAVTRVTGQSVPQRIAPRRAGDPAVLVADASRARTMLGWTARQSDIDTIVRTAWSWHRQERG